MLKWLCCSCSFATMPRRPLAGQTWDNYLDLWLRRVPPEGRFTRVDGVVQTLDDLTGREYVESDPLDLDHLSLGLGREPGV